MFAALALFILPLFPNPVSAAQALEVRCEKDPNAPWPFWTVPPLNGLAPNMFSTGGCQDSTSQFYPAPISGFKNFDQTWGPLVVPASGKVDFQFIQAGGLIGQFKVYVHHPNQPRVEILDLSSVKSYCAWLYPPIIIDLASFGFAPGQAYELELAVASNAHALYAFRIIPEIEISVGSKTWGAIKAMFRP